MITQNDSCSALCLTALAAGQVYSWHQMGLYSKATVISTWPWKDPNHAAWRNLNQPEGSALSAVVAGCSAADDDKSILSVGVGGYPDESGSTALSAMVMDGDSMGVCSFLLLLFFKLKLHSLHCDFTS